MNTCKYFAASQLAISAEPGIQLPADYEFDRPFNYSACFNKDLVGPGGFGGCSCEDSQYACPGYQADSGSVTRAVIVEFEDTPQFEDSKLLITMVRTRHFLGYPEFVIYSSRLADAEENIFGAPSIQHEISFDDCGTYTQEVADNMFEITCSAWKDNAQTEMKLTGRLDFSCEGWEEFPSYVEAVCQPLS